MTFKIIINFISIVIIVVIGFVESFIILKGRGYEDLQFIAWRRRKIFHLCYYFIFGQMEFRRRARNSYSILPYFRYLIIIIDVVVIINLNLGQGRTLVRFILFKQLEFKINLILHCVASWGFLNYCLN